MSPHRYTPANTAKKLCVAVIVALLVALVLGIAGCLSGSETVKRDAVKADVAWALRIAYDVGGRDAVSNRIEQLVYKGKLTREQADALHAAAEMAYEKIVDDLDPNGVAVVATESASDAFEANGDSCASGGEESAVEAPGAPRGDCSDDDCDDGGCDSCEDNEDANCGACEDCVDGECE